LKFSQSYTFSAPLNTETHSSSFRWAPKNKIALSSSGYNGFDYISLIYGDVSINKTT
jgi:hypothetical protein